MSNFSLDPMQIFGFADTVRSWLPWQWRPLVTNWLVLSSACAVATILFLAVHFAVREKSKIAWDFEKTGYPVRLNSSLSADGVRSYFVDGIEVGGENIAGHTLHQIDGEIRIIRGDRVVPVHIVADGQWTLLSDLDGGIPPRAMMFIGCGFRSDGLHCTDFPARMTSDQFLKDFGGFTLSVTIDGDKKEWSFTIDDLRDQFERQKREVEENYLTNPMNRPQLKRKHVASQAAG